MNKVCIIVPIYNVSKFIERCARSLFEQTFEDIQYIFVNDCTPDNSIEILERVIVDYPDRKEDIKIINHKVNCGIGTTRETGLAYANSEYFLFVDSDDYVDVNMVELMYNKAIEESADIVICNMMMTWGRGLMKIAHQHYSPNNIEYTKLLLSGKTMCGLVNKLIKLTVYQRDNMFSIANINMGEDYALSSQLAYYANKIAKVDLPLYHYVQLNNYSYTKTFSKKSIDDLICALNVLNEFFTNISDKKIYEVSLLEGQLNKKILMLTEANPKHRKEIAELFSETNSVLSTVRLTIVERITITLANKEMFICLNVFLCLYHALIELVQILKGRR